MHTQADEFPESSKLARHLSFRTMLSLPAAAVAEVSQTVNGALRVKMHDKHAALVSLGRHLGLFTDHVKVDAVYGISEEPMSAEEWKKQYVKEG